MPTPAKFEVVRWRSWPCEKCGGRTTVVGFLIGRHEANGAVRGGTPDEIIESEIALERKWLADWAASCPHGRGELVMNLAVLGEGSEHRVYLSNSRKHVMKLTLPGIFGDSYFLKDGRVNQRRCTPGDYLYRMRLLDSFSQHAPRPVGVTEQGQIVTLQKFIAGDPPTQAEADEFMALELEPVRQSCFLWKMAAPDLGLEFWVGDARDENFVKTPYGIIPIDLRMWTVPLRDE